MSIEEKAKEYVTSCVSNGQDALSYLARVEGRNGFVRGAEWMLEEVVKWISKHGYDAQYCRYLEEDGDYDIDLLLENLKKVMEK